MNITLDERLRKIWFMVANCNTMHKDILSQNGDIKELKDIQIRIEKLAEKYEIAK